MRGLRDATVPGGQLSGTAAPEALSRGSPPSRTRLQQKRVLGVPNGPPHARKRAAAAIDTRVIL